MASFPVSTTPKPFGIPDPKKRSGVKDIKSKLLNPALTSLYYVEVGQPQDTGWNDYSSANFGSVDQERLNLMCSEVSLPGSSLATLDITNDRTGVTEKHAYRRVYDDRIDLTFYVDAENHSPIRYFETWIKYIAQESVSGENSSVNKNYSYRMKYPDEYVSEQGLKVTKFEKSTKGIGDLGNIGQRGNLLTYVFIRAFPISISSMPVSYDSSSLLKCTVSMTYIRYVVNTGDPKLVETSQITPTPGSGYSYDGVTPGVTPFQGASPLSQATFNSGAFVNPSSAYFVPQSSSDRQPTPTELRQGVFRNADGTIRR